MKISFLLTGEGTSDLRLQSHIENILIGEGFSEVDGETPDLGALVPNVGRSVAQKLRALVKHYPHADVIFVHRDSDGVGAANRHLEITDSCVDIIGIDRVIPVIPTRMLETWLLADESALKSVAGCSNVGARLECLPARRQLEGVADPKALLLSVLCEASRTTGGRLARFKKRFGEMRARLAMDLDPAGPVNELASYRSFRSLVRAFAQEKLNGAPQNVALNFDRERMQEGAN